MKKLQLKFRIEVESGLCVGKGGLESGVDIATTRDSNQRLIIPGSTIKGKLRDECERVLRAKNPSSVCLPPRTEDMCPNSWGDEMLEKKDKFCDICDLFGSPWKKGRLYFSDAIAAEDVEICIRPGTAISRQRRVVDKGKLFFTETSPPAADLNFQGEIRGQLDEEKYLFQIALLCVGLRLIPSFGRARSRGLGWSKVEKEDILINEQKIAEQVLLDKIKEVVG